MELYRQGRFVTDDWRRLADDAPATAGRIVVTRARFLAERAALLARQDPIGLLLDAGDSLAGLAPDLARFGLIVLHLPRFSDGRPYSLARRLRDGHGFAGEIRASGDVLRDQLGLLLRAGFDSLEIGDPGTIAALRRGAIVAMRHHYQPAAPPVRELRAPGAPWRRRSLPVDAA